MIKALVLSNDIVYKTFDNILSIFDFNLLNTMEMFKDKKYE